jgi:hypothetical protein
MTRRRRWPKATEAKLLEALEAETVESFALLRPHFPNCSWISLYRLAAAVAAKNIFEASQSSDKPVDLTGVRCFREELEAAERAVFDEERSHDGHSPPRAS